MQRTILALAIASISAAAWAGPPVPSVRVLNTPLPVDVVTRNELELAELGPTTRMTCAAAETTQCERLLDLGSQPVALYELQYSILPGTTPAPDGIQCWMRVQLRDDASGPHEIVKFAWPANDLHGIVHALPMPIVLRPDQHPVASLLVGPAGLDPGVCNAELKLYTRWN